MNSKVKKSMVAFGIGVSLFLAVLYLIGIEEIITNILKINILIYLMSVGCIFASISLWVMRWKIFLKSDDENVPFTRLFQYLIMGFSVNNLTPIAKMGGEPVRAYILKKRENIKMRRGLATILADLSVFFLVTVFVVITSMILITLTFTPPIWLKVVLIGFVIFSIVVFLGLVGVYSDLNIIPKILNWIGSKIKRIRPYKEKLLNKYQEFQGTFKNCLDNKPIFLEAVVYTLIARCFELLKFFFLFLSLGFYMDPVKIFIALGIAAILMAVPATPGSLGIFEGGMISVFVMLGAPAGIAATVVFLERLVWYWLVTLIGGSLGAYYGIDILESGMVDEG